MNEVLERAQKVIAATRGPAFAQTPDAVTLSALANSSTTYVAKCGDFLWTRAAVKATGTFHCRIFSQLDGEYLDNDKIRSELFWGSGTYWMDIPPKFIPAGGELRFDLEDRSNGSNTIRLVLFGHKITRELELVKRLYGKGGGLRMLSTPAASANGTSTVGGTTVSANSTSGRSLNTDPSYTFRVAYNQANATSDSWRGTWSHYDVREAALSRLSPNLMDSTCWTGKAPTSSIQPFLLPSAVIARKQTSFEFEYQDYSGSNNTIHQTLIGERLSDDQSEW